jgi:hypothetical protein
MTDNFLIIIQKLVAYIRDSINFTLPIDAVIQDAISRMKWDNFYPDHVINYLQDPDASRRFLFHVQPSKPLSNIPQAKMSSPYITYKIVQHLVSENGKQDSNLFAVLGNMKGNQSIFGLFSEGLFINFFEKYGISIESSHYTYSFHTSNKTKHSRDFVFIFFPAPLKVTENIEEINDHQRILYKTSPREAFFDLIFKENQNIYFFRCTDYSKHPFLVSQFSDLCKQYKWKGKNVHFYFIKPVVSNIAESEKRIYINIEKEDQQGFINLTKIHNFYDAFFNITKNYDFLQTSKGSTSSSDQDKKPDPKDKDDSHKPLFSNRRRALTENPRYSKTLSQTKKEASPKASPKQRKRSIQLFLKNQIFIQQPIELSFRKLLFEYTKEDFQIPIFREKQCRFTYFNYPAIDWIKLNL